MRFKEASTSVRGNNTSDESIIGQLLPDNHIEGTPEHIV
jgi:hypothetical protein